MDNTYWIWETHFTEASRSLKMNFRIHLPLKEPVDIFPSLCQEERVDTRLFGLSSVRNLKIMFEFSQAGQTLGKIGITAV